MDKEGEYQYFSSKNFCVTAPKKFVRESFSVSLISGSKKFMDKRGSIKILRRKFLTHSSEKIRR